MNHPTKYAAYVAPPMSEARIDAQWMRIAPQLPPPRKQRSWTPKLAFGLMAACALVLGLWLRPARHVESVWEGSVVASDDAPVDVTLAEGTLIELDPQSEVKLLSSTPSSVQLMLNDGSAMFEVAKRPTRRFTVQAGSVEVLVTGTQFRVTRSEARDGERVRVDVEEGSVEIRRRGERQVKLAAGEHWSGVLRGEDLPLTTTKPMEADDANDVANAKVGPRRSKRQRSHRKDAETPATRLFDRANLARRAGRLRDAAHLYAQLVDQHPRDRRAALCAFELGRLRMDSLSEMRGAIRAFEQALLLDARRSFAEDAMARLVLAYEAVGERGACRTARERYVSRYPDGVHLQHIAARCGGI